LSSACSRPQRSCMNPLACARSLRLPSRLAVSRWPCGHNRKAAHRSAPLSRWPDSADGLRAGVPLAVIAKIGSRGRVVGPVALRAIARVIAATAGNYGDAATVIIVAAVVVVIGVA